MDLILKLRNITFGYPNAPPILNALDFDLRRGEKAGLVGYNGSGKTTLLHVIMGLRQPAAGTLEILGRPAVTGPDFQLVRQRVGLLFQDADDQLFSPTVLEDVSFGPLNQGQTAAAAEETARRVLADVGLAGFEERVTHRLSGGEKKLVALATVLAMTPDVLLLDEPTTGLDQETRGRIIGILRRLDLACLVISHDYEFLAAVTGCVYFMRAGRIMLDEKAEIHSHFHVHSFGGYPHQHSTAEGGTDHDGAQD
jgi:cobalt/nickel transport system ATP-binding protein